MARLSHSFPKGQQSSLGHRLENPHSPAIFQRWRKKLVYRGILAVLVAAIVLEIAVTPATAFWHNWRDCIQERDIELSIRSCTSFIGKRDPNKIRKGRDGDKSRGMLSSAYESRARAYYMKGDLDRALADFDCTAARF